MTQYIPGVNGEEPKILVWSNTDSRHVGLLLETIPAKNVTCSCGHSIHAKSARYCVKCGEKLHA